MRKTAKYPAIVATAIAVFVGCGDMTENLNAELSLLPEMS